MASISLQLDQDEQAHTAGDRVGIRQTVQATGTGMESAIFVYASRYQAAPENGILNEFSHVATIPELDYPIGAPDIDGGIPWMRQASLEVWHRTLEEADEFWDLVQGAVQALVDAINRGSTTTTVVIS